MGLKEKLFLDDDETDQYDTRQIDITTLSSLLIYSFR